MEKLITKSFNRLLEKGIHRGFITYEELGKSLGKRHYTHENIEKSFMIIFDKKVTLVKEKKDYQSFKKKDSSSSESSKSGEVDKSDDPIRMYLREMGGVDLLSREGEIAIAKRIEEGKSVMIGALSKSPITAQKIFEWKSKLESNELLVREIIDIDSSYVDIESEESSPDEKEKTKDKKPSEEKIDKSKNDLKEKNNDKENEALVEDEFNPSLAVMEAEIKPQVLASMNFLFGPATIAPPTGTIKFLSVL